MIRNDVSGLGADGAQLREDWPLLLHHNSLDAPQKLLLELEPVRAIEFVHLLGDVGFGQALDLARVAPKRGDMGSVVDEFRFSKVRVSLVINDLEDGANDGDVPMVVVMRYRKGQVGAGVGDSLTRVVRRLRAASSVDQRVLATEQLVSAQSLTSCCDRNCKASHRLTLYNS